MLTSPGCTLLGTLADVSGNVIAGATVTMSLCNYGPSIPYISGSSIFAQLVISAVSNSYGYFTMPFYGNYQVNPTNTFYQVTVALPGYTSLYTDSNLNESYQFLAGGSFDISTITPLNNAYYNPVIPPNFSYLTFSYEEVPAGTINGSNATFTLANTPVPTGSLNLYENGLRMTRGIAYTISSNTITYNAGYIPQDGDTHICDYTYN
jgi:hypothetical protein